MVDDDKACCRLLESSSQFSMYASRNAYVLAKWSTNVLRAMTWTFVSRSWRKSSSEQETVGGLKSYIYYQIITKTTYRSNNWNTIRRRRMPRKHQSHLRRVRLFVSNDVVFIWCNGSLVVQSLNNEHSSQIFHYILHAYVSTARPPRDSCALTMQTDTCNKSIFRKPVPVLPDGQSSHLIGISAYLFFFNPAEKWHWPHPTFQHTLPGRVLRFIAMMAYSEARLSCVNMSIRLRDESSSRTIFDAGITPEAALLTLSRCHVRLRQHDNNMCKTCTSPIALLVTLRFSAVIECIE